MVNTFTFSPHAIKQLKKLDKAIENRILQKLHEWKRHDDIDSVLKVLYGYEPATHRLRIGDYRIIVKRESNTDFVIYDIGHRKDIYR